MYFLPDDQILRVTGEKAAKFLHGQFSNTVTDLKPGEANHHLFLTTKGKVLAQLIVCAIAAGDFLCLIPQPFFEVVVSHLKKLAPLSKVEIKQLFPDYRVVHGVEEQFASSQGWIFKTDRFGVSGSDCIMTQAKGEEFQKNHPIISLEKAEGLRVKNGIPKVGPDLNETNLPQEGGEGILRTLHFNKGCYLGQEVVARLEHRGHVNKILQNFVSEGVVAVAESVMVEQDAIGKVTSVAQFENKFYFFAMVNVKDLDGKKSFTVETGRGRPVCRPV